MVRRNLTLGLVLTRSLSRPRCESNCKPLAGNSSEPGLGSYPLQRGHEDVLGKVLSFEDAIHHDALTGENSARRTATPHSQDSAVDCHCCIPLYCVSETVGHGPKRAQI